MKCLITGFEPFLQRSKNPSMELLPLLKEELSSTIDLKTLLLPVVFEEVFVKVKEAIDQFQPDMIIHLGLAENRDKIALERVAINVNDARVPDNQGNQPIDEPIKTDGENAYFSSLPLREFEKILHREKIPVYISNTAGAYVCNHVMYQTLHYISIKDLPIKAGFIHLPLMHEQANNNEPSLSLEEMKKAIVLMVNRSQ